MGLSTYTELKSEIARWANRTNATSNDLDTFIKMAESAMFNNPDQTLSTTDDSAKTTLTMDSATPSRYIDFPTGFLTVRGLNLVENNERYKITFNTPDRMKITDTQGKPVFYTITNRFEFSSEPDQDYTLELDYFRKFTALSTSNETNSVLESAPNIYLFGALWAFKMREEEDQQAQKYWVQFLSEIQGFNRQQQEQRYSTGSPISYDGMIV